MLAELVARKFEETYGSPPQIVAQAPGRVNLIGEHTDYNDAYVFPAAIDRFVVVAASPSAKSEYLSIDLGLADASGKEPSWSKFPEGMSWVFRQDGLSVPPLRALVGSNLPIGAGVSSSAAIEMAFGSVWNELGGFGLSMPALARVGQRCENDFVGVQTGLMDQMASACGKAGHAMFFDTKTLEVEYAPLPIGVSIVVADTTKSRELAGSKYNERRAECAEACQVLGIESLRWAGLDLLEVTQEKMRPEVFRRARHVVTENMRCLKFREVLRRGELDQIGSLMKASHLSLRDDYEVSCAELDFMADACWKAPGCIGARMTGAGFGGACVALVQDDQLEEFIEDARSSYQTYTGLAGRFMACQAADGAQVVARHG